MAEYIERETVLEILCGKGAAWDAYSQVQSIPAADVRPVEWISVTERLPEHDKNVLICYEWTGRSGTVYREVGIASIEELERDPTEMFRPLYWMPLPEPPKEATDG